MKRLALDIFHYEVEDPVFRLAKIRNTDGIRMLYRSSGLGLALKTHDRLALLEVFAIQNVVADGLDGNFSGVEFVVLGEKNIAHRAASQTAFQQIPAVQKLRPAYAAARIRAVVRAQCHLVGETELACRTFLHRYELS